MGSRIRDNFRNGLVLWVLIAALLVAFLPGSLLPGSLLPGSLERVSAASGQDSSGPVVMLRFDGALHPVMTEHLKRAQQIAESEGAQAIILELDTPGGDISLMNQIVEQIRASQVPVIVYISPRGAMAGSAGTLVTLAGHLAAMAPETTIGAASPVGSNGEDIGTTMQSKIKEMLKATVRTLASNRPPDAVKQAQDMIDSAKAISADEALKIGLVDFQANSLDDLIKQLDGRQVKVGSATHTLHTAGARIITVNKTFMEDMLMVLANPNIAFLLLAIGVQAILIEISSPGGWIAGFTGAVCLLLATYGMGLLPVNWFGLLFLALAFLLFILDIKAPTHGALTAAGVATFIVGALVLFNSPNVPSFQRVSVPLVVGTGVTLGLFFFVLVGFALRAQRIPVKTGRGSLLGQVGVVTTPLNPVGTVQLESELWTAVIEDGGKPVPKGARVEVIATDSLRVRVKKVEE